MDEFKFFKGTKPRMSFTPAQEQTLLTQRFRWIPNTSLDIEEYDVYTGGFIRRTYTIRPYIMTFNQFIEINRNNLMNIYTITGEETGMIPYGTTIGEMGIYNWNEMFTITAVIL